MQVTDKRFNIGSIFKYTFQVWKSGLYLYFIIPQVLHRFCLLLQSGKINHAINNDLFYQNNFCSNQ